MYDARHVQRRDRQADEQRQDEHDVVERSVVHADEDLVLRPEAGERHEAGHRQRADEERRCRDRHLAPRAAELVDLLLLRRVDDGAAAEEEQRLEEARATKQVEHRRADGVAEAERDEHQPEAVQRRVGDDALDVASAPGPCRRGDAAS